MDGDKKDNSTFPRKTSLRSRMLMKIEDPIIMETHGGAGRIWKVCYSHIQQGVVFEKDPFKSEALALQRPTWAVYETNCEGAIRQGAGSHLEVNFLDLDPYGEPWPAMEAFFLSTRPFAPRMAVVVNDGLRQKLKMNGGWAVASLHDVVERIGNAKLYKNYIEVCRELTEEKAAYAGYVVKEWSAYYCGHGSQMTHYAAVLEKEQK